MELNKGDIIKEGNTYYSVFCIVWNVVYVNMVPIAEENCVELADVLKRYRKIEIMKSK